MTIISPQDDKASRILERYGELKNLRVVWETLWEDCREFAYPNAKDFTTQNSAGLERNLRIFDDTPAQALQTAASGIIAFTTNPFDKWFRFETVGKEEQNDPELLLALSKVEDILYAQLRDPDVRFIHENHMLVLSWLAFGTGVQLIERNMRTRQVRYRTVPLKDCYLAENADGMVDEVYRCIKLTSKQAVQMFGDAVDDRVVKGDKNKMHEFIHAVYPADFEEEETSRWQSCYVCVTSRKIMREGSYDIFPYLTPRWQTIPGEVYGRSPLMDTLTNIRMLNALQKFHIESAAIQALPPVVIENTSCLTPWAWEPGHVVLLEQGFEPPRPVAVPGIAQMSENLVGFLRSQIRQALFNDFLAQPNYGSRDRVTAEEVRNQSERQLQALAPMLGRFTLEYLQPMLHRTFSIYKSFGYFDNLPDVLRGKQLNLNYISQAAQAQRAQRSNNMRRLLSDLIPLAQIDQSVFDALDIQGLVQDLMTDVEISRERIRTPEQLAAINQQKQQQQMLAQMASNVGTAAGALKDVSVAGKNTPQLLGL